MKQVHEIEHGFKNGHSHLEVICGPMFSGKTEELIRRCRRVDFAKMRALVFKPMIDARYSLDLVVSHSEQKIKSVPVANASEIRDFLGREKERVHVVGLDEVQFFDSSITQLCEDLVERGIRVIAAGLCEDYLGKPFGPVPELLAHADSVTKLWAICMRCGAPASKTQRIVEKGQKMDDKQVLIGAASSYEARCRACHEKRVVLSAE